MVLPTEIPDLLVTTPPDWAPHAVTDMGAFLLDHASCERKASAVGMSFVVRYPDRTALIEPMIRFAREELYHFQQVVRLVQARGLSLEKDEPDPYVNTLMQSVRFGREERFLDRLLVSALIECRGAERLRLVAQTLTDPALKRFYERLAGAEAHHFLLFRDLAAVYFPTSVWVPRWRELQHAEVHAISNAPYRYALH